MELLRQKSEFNYFVVLFPSLLHLVRKILKSSYSFFENFGSIEHPSSGIEKLYMFGIAIKRSF